MKKYVLLVDDEAGIIHFMESFLERLKIPSLKTTSGIEALGMYNKETVELVLLDVKLKDTDGFSVLENLRQNNPDAKVIIMTGRPETDFEEKAKQLGAIDYITKPVDLKQLKDKVSKYM